MSIDTVIQLRTPIPAREVRLVLAGDPALADLRLEEDPNYETVACDLTCLVVRPWEEDDHHSIDGGFDTADLRCKAIPGRGDPGWIAMHRVIAALLRLVPGDACLGQAGGDRPELLRLGDIVYLDPEGYAPENLTGFGYTPTSLVTGIPERRS